MIRFEAFLYERRVSDVLSPACQCGWRRQDRKHLVIFCPNHGSNRHRLFRRAETQRYREILSTGKGLRAVAKWIMREGLLGQFLLAGEQLAGAGKEGDGAKGDEEEEVEGVRGDWGGDRLGIRVGMIRGV